jgi:hypothetical protein
MTLRLLRRTMPGGGREIGSRYAGVPGSAIPANAVGNPPWMYPSLQLPADATKQYRYWIESHNFPFGLPLADDSTGVIPGLPTGTYTAKVWLIEEDVILSPAFTVTITVDVPAPPPAPAEFSAPRARVVLGPFVITIEPLR